MDGSLPGRGEAGVLSQRVCGILESTRPANMNNDKPSLAPSLSPPQTEKGFFREVLAGRGGSLADAFAGLRVSPYVSWSCEFPERGLFGARVTLDKRDGEGFFDFLEIRDSIYIVTENLIYADPRLEFLPGDGLLSFHVRLAGVLTLSVGRRAPVQVAGPSLLVWHQPNGISASEWHTPGRRELSVTVYCRPAFIKDALITDGTPGPRHIERFLGESDDSINFCQLPVTSDILAAATSVATSCHQGRLRLIHMEGKALELYCLILSAFDRLAEAVEEQYSAKDLECLRRAREILASRFSPVPTIQSIARELGINESKLKRGFKALFGKTVFEFGHECRMQHAMQLLRDQHLRIGLVADAVGYTHQTTFASAFKQHFGYRPKEIRKLPLSAPPIELRAKSAAPSSG